MPRVSITGLGAITPIGITVSEFFQNLLAGKHGVIDFTQHPLMKKYRMRKDMVNLAALMPIEEAITGFSADMQQRYDPQTLSILAALEQALQDANFSSVGRNTAVLVGSAVGLRPTIERMEKAFLAYAQFSTDLLPEPHYYSKNFLDEFATSTILQAISREYLPHCMAIPLTSLCVSGANTLIVGYELIKAGVIDSAIAIGFDFFHPRQNQVFSHFKLLDTQSIRPFDKKRTGFQLGESIGVVVMEAMDRDAASEPTPYAEMIGANGNCDAHHLVIPDASGRPQHQTMKMALQEAGIQPEQLDIIASVGKGSKVGDQAEARAINRLLDKSAGRIRINSLVPNIGYTLGASSIMNFIALMKEMRESVIYPTINIDQLDPSLGSLNIHTGAPAKHKINYALSLGSAFLGGNTAIVLRNAKPMEEML